MGFKRVFIGWGPGGNVDFEKIWFKDNASTTLYWNQSPVSEENALAEYLSNADDFFKTLTHSGEYYELIVHSFGAQILFHWINQHQSLPFSRIKIFAANFNPFNAYKNLGDKCNVHLFDPKNPCVTSFWNHLQGLMQDPELFNYYWLQPGGPTHLQYQNLQNEVPHLNLETFQRVMSDFIRVKGIKLKNKFSSSIPVEIHLGKQDPLLNIDEELKAWGYWFPESKISLHDGGHFLHLEKPELF